MLVEDHGKRVPGESTGYMEKKQKGAVFLENLETTLAALANLVIMVKGGVASGTLGREVGSRHVIHAES